MTTPSIYKKKVKLLQLYIINDIKSITNKKKYYIIQCAYNEEKPKAPYRERKKCSGKLII